MHKSPEFSGLQLKTKKSNFDIDTHEDVYYTERLRTDQRIAQEMIHTVDTFLRTKMRSTLDRQDFSNKLTSQRNNDICSRITDNLMVENKRENNLRYENKFSINVKAGAIACLRRVHPEMENCQTMDDFVFNKTQLEKLALDMENLKIIEEKKTMPKILNKKIPQNNVYEINKKLPYFKTESTFNEELNNEPKD